jgi:arylsulfatase A-like enzyme
MKISTTAFVILSVTIGLLSACQGNKELDQEAEQAPNIILLMGDDHGWDETGYNGHPHVQTPVLDEMASQGLRFDRFYSAHPSCSPTRGSFMTGRHPNRYGTFAPNWSIRPEEITIAHLLGEAGYVAAHFGKWHLGPVKKESPTSPGAMGFDEWLSHDNFFELNPTLSRNGEAPRQLEGESSQILVDEAIQFIRRATDKQQPFFVVVWYGSPHEPYSGLPGDLALYDDLPSEYAERSVRLTSNETGEPVDRPLRDVLRERYAEITAMDRSIGMLREYLREAGLRENTLLWYCGDNGTPSSAARTGMTLRGQKGTMYEGGIRVPGVLEWPARVPSGRSVTVNAVTSDFLPTLLDLTGQPLAERRLDGVSLAPVINGDMEIRPDPIFFWEFPTGKVFDENARPYIDPQLQEGTTPLVKMMDGKYTRSFRNFQYGGAAEPPLGGPRVMMDGRYKLLLEATSSQEPLVELFDLVEDSAEKHNLADAQPEIVEKMQRRLQDWQKSVLRSLEGKDYR